MCFTVHFLFVNLKCNEPTITEGRILASVPDSSTPFFWDGHLLDFSVPPFPHLSPGDSKTTYFIAFLEL